MTALRKISCQSNPPERLPNVLDESKAKEAGEIDGCVGNVFAFIGSIRKAVNMSFVVSKARILEVINIFQKPPFENSSRHSPVFDRITHCYYRI